MRMVGIPDPITESQLRAYMREPVQRAPTPLTPTTQTKVNRRAASQNHQSVNMFYGAFFFLIGSWIAITRCFAGSQEVAATEICLTQLDVDEETAGIMLFVTVAADEHEVVAQEKYKCFVDCIAREAGYLNSDDEFTVSEFVEKDLVSHQNDDTDDEKMKSDHKTLIECAEIVENWDGWDRTVKCNKGYLFFKCKSFGVDGFKLYMEVQRQLSTGELKPLGQNPSEDESGSSDSTSEYSESDGAVRTTEKQNWNGTEETISIDLATEQATPEALLGLCDLSLTKMTAPSSH